jgi:hypothetical protein
MSQLWTDKLNCDLYLECTKNGGSASACAQQADKSVIGKLLAWEKTFPFSAQSGAVIPADNYLKKCMEPQLYPLPTKPNPEKVRDVFDTCMYYWAYDNPEKWDMYKANAVSDSEGYWLLYDDMFRGADMHWKGTGDSIIERTDNAINDWCYNQNSGDLSLVKKCVEDSSNDTVNSLVNYVATLKKTNTKTDAIGKNLESYMLDCKATTVKDTSANPGLANCFLNWLIDSDLGDTAVKEGVAVTKYPGLGSVWKDYQFLEGTAWGKDQRSLYMHHKQETTGMGLWDLLKIDWDEFWAEAGGTWVALWNNFQEEKYAISLVFTTVYLIERIVAQKAFDRRTLLTGLILFSLTSLFSQILFCTLDTKRVTKSFFPCVINGFVGDVGKTGDIFSWSYIQNHQWDIGMLISGGYLLRNYYDDLLSPQTLLVALVLVFIPPAIISISSCVQNDQKPVTQCITEFVTNVIEKGLGGIWKGVAGSAIGQMLMAGIGMYMFGKAGMWGYSKFGGAAEEGGEAGGIGEELGAVAEEGAEVAPFFL